MLKNSLTGLLLVLGLLASSLRSRRTEISNRAQGGEDRNIRGKRDRPQQLRCQIGLLQSPWAQFLPRRP